MKKVEDILRDFRSKFVGIREADDIEMIPTSIRPEKIEKWLRAILEERERSEKHNAYCECGDALERKELYPSQATYYCFGCDKEYVLVELKGG